MPWQKIDDQFGISQKVIRIPRKRRQQCIGLWTLTGNYAVRALTDGVVEQHELDELDAKDVDVAELVRVALWHHAGHACESCVQPPAGGIVIHDFLVYNKSREQVYAEREAAAERMRRKRAKDASSDDVRANTSRTPPELQSQFAPPVPSRPDPTSGLDIDDETQIRPEVDASVSTDINEIVQQRAQRAGITDLRRIHGVLERAVKPIGPLSPMAAVILVETIVARSRNEVRDVDGYVIVAARTPSDIQSAYEAEDLEHMSRQTEDPRRTA